MDKDKSYFPAKTSKTQDKMYEMIFLKTLDI